MSNKSAGGAKNRGKPLKGSYFHAGSARLLHPLRMCLNANPAADDTAMVLIRGTHFRGRISDWNPAVWIVFGRFRIGIGVPET